MRRFKMPREFYIPKNATKIADKLSDAVAYVRINDKSRPQAVIFFGKQAKPVSNYWYRSEEARNAAVASAFESRRKSLAFKAERKAKRVAWVPDYKVGDILRTSWGYDQTNVEYFEITEIKGKYATLREIAAESTETGWMTGRCAPLPGEFLEPRFKDDDQGLPIRRLMQEHGIKICDVRTAFRMVPTTVAGVKVYGSSHWSNTH
jgi:hypothetical protein